MIRSHLLCAVGIILLSGCVSTHRFADESEIYASSPKTVDLLTQDSDLYHLTYYALEDTDIRGIGTVRHGDSTKAFRGGVPYRTVRYMESNDISTGKTLMAVAGTAVFVGFAVTALSRSSDVSAKKTTHYVAPVSAGSCPLLYSFDGSNYVFESEAAGGAMSPFLEYTQLDDLRHMAEVNGSYRLLLTQDESETDHVDQLHLVAVDHAPGITVLADSGNRLHTIGNLIEPIEARDRLNGDCTAALEARDGNVWQRDIRTDLLRSPQDFRDEVTISFPRPNKTTTAKLVIDGQNTPLGDFALSAVLSLAGRDRLQWYNQLDHDPKEAYAMDDFIRREAWLRVEVLERDGWHQRANLRIPGERAIRSMLAVLDLSNVAGDTLTVRVFSTAGGWILDAAGIDYSKDQPVTETELLPVSALDTHDRDGAPLLTEQDGKRLDLMRGDSVLITFHAPPPTPGKERSLFARTTSYFHSWFYADDDPRSELRTAIYSIPGLAATILLPQWKKQLLDHVR